MRVGRRWIGFVLPLGALLVACSTTVTSSGSPASRSSTATSDPSDAPTPDPTAGSRAVRFAAGEHVRLAGRVFGSGPVGVVLAHQVDNDQSAWFPYAQRLAARGYRVLTFDLRGHCPGGVDGCSSGGANVEASADDVDAAVRFIQGGGVRTVFLIGASVGGQAVLVSAARSGGAIAGVVSLSAPEFFAYEITAGTLAGVTMPSLFIAGRSDGDAAASARDFSRWVRGPTDLLVIDTSEHGTDLVSPASPTVASTVSGRILAFLKRHASG
jgi:pimeloyl-ACP methyl ester carboxylesterase